MSCSTIAIVDFDRQFVCLVIISLVSILRYLNLLKFKGTIMQI